MVHVKRVELSHFKSFGGTTQIPFLPGFTVISGPNGSGKSNILDALLFCLGLATSRGMRAERLPDLVNHNHSTQRHTAEASVSVTFDISDWMGSQIVEETSDDNSNNGDVFQGVNSQEWTVTRRLKVGKGGSYSSIYYINGQPCTVTELHEQLNQLRIYPEGYNVVLQGDVTRIITMNSKERREIIDELAGVAEFDRKIQKTKETLESVREREERCHIIEQELARTLERLASDRIKAEKYQKLKLEVQQKQQWEAVLRLKYLQQQIQQLQAQLADGAAQSAQFQTQLNTLSTQIEQTSISLEQLNQQVKALGEEEQLSVASQMASHKAKRHQLQQRQQELENIATETKINLEQVRSDLVQYQDNIEELICEKIHLESEKLPQLIQETEHWRKIVDNSRKQADEIAAASETWVQEQTKLTRNISQLQDSLNPKQTEQAKLTERYLQLQKNLEQQTQTLQATQAELAEKETESTSFLEQVTVTEEEIKNIAHKLAIAEQERTIQQDTQKRLQKEQRDKQRELDKLEAKQQAQQEAQGTYATQVILQSDLPGVCGLVAHLGKVQPQYQLALEIAAGSRLGHIVVEDDSIAAAGIGLLKQRQIGRATFLPLNKIQPSRFPDTTNVRLARGFIDLAFNLVECEARYQKIFSYVFGATIVFDNIDDARLYLGKYRIVTLEGELLEISGAMTGGSKPPRSALRFGVSQTKDSTELDNLRNRLRDLETILSRNEEEITQKSIIVNELSQSLTQVRQRGKEYQFNYQQIQRDIQRLSQQKEDLKHQIIENNQEIKSVLERLDTLLKDIPILEEQLAQQQRRLSELEESQSHSQWLQIQSLLKTQESELKNREQNLRQIEEKIKDLSNQKQRLEEKMIDCQQRLQIGNEQAEKMQSQKAEIEEQILNISNKITETENLLQQLNQKIGETKKERDRTETVLHSLQKQQQQTVWELEKLTASQEERQIKLQSLQEQMQSHLEEIHQPLPELPEFLRNEENLNAQLEKIQQEIRNGQKRLESMEPVNMLALEEYEKTKERLDELSSKLSTLEAERTELLLRVENFTTLRFRAFKEAFDAVDENFRSIFATLSEGDGHLQLDDEENPFNGGLNLVAHPKGKPVQRLSSMSGGEKSLTALSFIFALQRYRPSPFYAFDEVDMFLDGANVERLSKMIRQQAQQAQFIVVSLRRPMIEAAERTIGVTQARGAYTQVLGIKL